MNISSANAEMNTSTQICAYPKPFSTLHLFLLCGASTIALIGIISNGILSAFFIKSKTGEPNLFLLALLDGLLCLCYVGLFGVEAVGSYFKLNFAYDMLYFYTLCGFVVSKIVQLAIPLMLILTSLERWSWLAYRHRKWSILRNARSRGISSIILLLMAVCIRLPVAWAIEIRTYPKCPNYFQTKEVWPTDLMTSKKFHLYDLFITSSQTFGIFFILLVLNIAMVAKLRSRRKKKQSIILQLLKPKKTLEMNTNCHNSLVKTLEDDLLETTTTERNAIMSFVVIVSAYLTCSSFHVLLTCAEYWVPSLVYEGYGWSDFYVISRDVINFLFMLCSAVRLEIYLTFNHLIRRQMKQMFGLEDPQLKIRQQLPLPLLKSVSESEIIVPPECSFYRSASLDELYRTKNRQFGLYEQCYIFKSSLNSHETAV